MPRIRSVHPGFFRDDRLVPCSAFARLLFIGLGVEADDKGIFEWKPVTLKMSVFPGDNIDMAALLAELVEADAIRQFDVTGKRYGAIRNFRKYQKPKTPNDVYPMADGIAEYVSLPHKEENAATDAASFLPKVENHFQMEDGGGEEEDEKKAPPSPQGGEAGGLFDLVEAAMPRSPTYNQAKAERAFRKLSPADQQALHSKALAFGPWWATEQTKRNRSMADSLRYAPPLDKWISDGAWRSFEPAGAGGQPSPDLVVIREGDPLIPAIERVRGRKVIFGDRGTSTVTRAEVEKAQEQAAA